MSPVETLVFRPASLPPLSRLVLAAAVRVVMWETRQRTRKDLRRLSPHLLRDVGIDPMTAQAESSRRFWQE
ncbi:MAG: DUF1127 domain-containing protein [Pseudotabrizicola sp.]|uniref:DUF1127 domain-containing protein n=1 Tax=Pseudotabrizicola sp. TaxID=2939647 RepID=UPI0027168F26|nr:DUF1127 domain-containing protein [Pseudotabrizicola sp.]MDO9638714.1 DUF1127 domain-containing protein [Pseudotabrizicola sp.]